MASNNEQLFNSDRTSKILYNSSRTNEYGSRSSGTSLAKSVNEVNELNQRDDILLQTKIDEDSPLIQICHQYEISFEMAKYLLQLKDFDIAIVCDDSGSMGTIIDGTERTRWDELCRIVKIIVEIGVVFDSDGVDIYFLNRKPPLLNVTKPKDVDRAFRKRPKGFTPLVPVLTGIFESRLKGTKRDKKLLVFIATDGEPTDKYGNPNLLELDHVLREKRPSDKIYISFLACTDNAESVEYLRKWDRTMPHLDVTDDFDTEREKIRECQENKNYSFSRGDYIVKALVGSIVPKLDNLNERKLKKKR